MKPDAIFKCIKSYEGENKEGKYFSFTEGNEYSRTTVDMKKMGHGKKGITYFIHSWNEPSKTMIELSYDEFNKLDGQYFSNIRQI